MHIAGDYPDETDESFSLILPDTRGASRGIPETTVFIQDNDMAQRPYRDWLLSHFNAAERRTAVTDTCADPDGDQINNALEFFLDSNPRSAVLTHFSSVAIQQA